MRESTAWKILAEEHDAGTSGSYYLCNALTRTADGSISARLAQIPLQVRRNMKARIESALGGTGAAAYNDFGDDTTSARVLACLVFAEQARDEERAHA